MKGADVPVVVVHTIAIHGDGRARTSSLDPSGHEWTHGMRPRLRVLERYTWRDSEMTEEGREERTGDK